MYVNLLHLAASANTISGSTTILGYAFRHCRAKTHIRTLSPSSVVFLRRPRAGAHICVLASHTPALHPSNRFSEYHCPRSELLLLKSIETQIWAGAGVIGDITTQDKRGGVYGLFITGPLVCTVTFVHSSFMSENT